MSPPIPLAKYNEKRDFTITPEPSGQAVKTGELRSFVIQKHWATRLHYDFRLELDGVLLSWAVPKGPSYDPSVKRMAIHVEDHPVSYGGFEGRIPEKQYGAGDVIVWDRGTWEPINDPQAGMRDGKMVFAMHGEKMVGQWELVKIGKPDDRQEAWLLFKKKDAWARPADVYDVVTAYPDSVIAKPLGPAVERGLPGGPVAPVASTKGPVAKQAGVQAAAIGAGADEATKTASKKAAKKAEKKAAKKAPAGRAAAADAGGPPAGAVRAPLPETLAPQLATLAKESPKTGSWSIEAKFDGYRILSRISGGHARLFTRNGNDWTDKLASVAEAVESLGLDEAWLDGEIVVSNAHGGQDFNALQNAIDASRNEGIGYYVFDAPFLAGHDLRQVPLVARRAALKNALAAQPNDRIRFSDAFDASPDEVLQAACAMKLEGIILKRTDAAYASSRNDDWLKLKCSLRQEFVIGGYTDRANSTKEVGNLLLGVYDTDGKLRYAGAMGTGWTLAVAAELKKKLAALEIPKSPFEAGSTKQTRWSRRAAGAERWVRPELVCEASFAEWTPEGHLRHASFRGLRTDKPATSIVQETAVAPPTAAAATDPPEDAAPAAAPTATQRGRPKGAVAEASTRAATKTRAASVSATATKAAAKTSTKAAATEAAAKTATKTAAKAAAKTAKQPATQPATQPDTQPATQPATATSPRGKPSDAQVDGMRVSSPARVVDAQSGATKLDLVRYYDSVADFILPHLAGRPVSLVRGPSGVAGELFFQKHLESKMPGVTVLDAKLWPGHSSLIQIDTKEALLSAAQMNTIEFHTWNAKSKAVDTPDRMIFDLDPGEGVGWQQIQEAATLTKAILDELGLVSFLKTSGGKGLHVVVPITPKLDWDTVKGFSQAVVQHLARTIPDRFVAKAGGGNRIGRIFVDWLRNGHGATTAVAFSARSRPGLGVSVPVPWDALPALKGGAQWTIATARDAVSLQKADPWADYATTKQTIAEPMKRLGYEP